MSTRWMAVQYVGDTLRLPIVNEGDMESPFGGSVLERDVRRIVVNPFSDNPQTFVPESENAKLRELCVKALEWLRWAGGITCPPEVPDEFADELRELGIEELDA